MKNKVNINYIQKTSLMDYPDKISTIVFMQGCNFRCSYCHNPELLSETKKTNVDSEKFFEYLQTRRNKIDGVVITGGEPCLQEGLKDFVSEIKKYGFLVKLDTNGAFPEKIKELLPYLDYIAMDIKAPLNKYPMIINSYVNIDDIEKSIDIIMSSDIDYEFRTTVIKSLLTFNDFIAIGNLINGAGKYYLQKFIPSKILDKNMLNESTYNDSEFLEISKLLKKYIKNVYLR